MSEFVVLVDENDNELGVMEKMEAHQKGVLHRAFSVFIFNDAGKMLLQRRALSKYHSAGLWTNACCSHPRPNETTLDAANRRLMEEMGMQTQLELKTSFIYKTQFDNDLTEHELDYIFIGRSNENPVINREEVQEYNWLSTTTIHQAITKHPDDFTSWFKIAMAKFF
jgi:isopentenyl-diphosphate Delta-isomerase